MAAFQYRSASVSVLLNVPARSWRDRVCHAMMTLHGIILVHVVSPAYVH